MSAGDRNQFRLLAERRFGPFFGVQFLGAFNDNVFKQALVILIAFHAAGFGGLAPEVMVNLAGGLFILPFFLFSATAGQLADKYDKARIIRLVKVLEIAIMVIAAAGFVRHDVVLLLAALCLLGFHSTLFGPVKYAILPQALHEQELVGGNALVETGTSLAILAGTILGGLLIALPSGPGLLVPVVTIGVAVLGYAVSRFVPLAPPPQPGLAIDWNPVTETWRNLEFTRRNRTVFLSILGVSWFWFFGALMIAQFPAYARTWLGGDEGVATALFATLSIGIGVGSLLCERMSGHKVEIGLVPFGSIGLTVFALDLFFATPSTPIAGTAGIGAFLAAPGSIRILADVALIGLFGGFYIVPLYALIQSRSDRSHQSRIIAGNNILNALFIVAAALVGAGFLSLGATVPQLFLLTAVLNAAVAAFIYAQVPEFLMRFLAWLLVHSVYRLQKTGPREHPRGRSGGARLQPRQLRRRGGDHGRVPAADPVRDGPLDLQDPGAELHLPHRRRDPDRVAQGRPGDDGAGVRRGRRGAPRRPAGRDLPGGPDHRHGRDPAVPPRHPADRRGNAGAGGAARAARAVGQLLQPQGRAGDDEALPPRAVREDRPRGVAAGAAGAREPGGAAGRGAGAARGLALTDGDGRGERMTWFIGALIGAALGVAIDQDAWLAGAIIGGVIGWLVGRKRAESTRTIATRARGRRPGGAGRRPARAGPLQAPNRLVADRRVARAPAGPVRRPARRAGPAGGAGA